MTDRVLLLPDLKIVNAQFRHHERFELIACIFEESNILFVDGPQVALNTAVEC